jgi:hypothetical protein
VKLMVKVFSEPATTAPDHRRLLNDPDVGLQMAGLAYLCSSPDLDALRRLSDLALTPKKPFTESGR